MQVTTQLSTIRIGISPWIMPRGGFYLWCALPDGRDSAEIARRCLAEDVVLAPGNVFSHAQSAGGFMRFNAAQTSEDAIRVLGRVLVESRAAGRQG